MRIGKFSFRQRWIDREVSPSLTYAVGMFLVSLGFVVGVLVGRGGWDLSWSWFWSWGWEWLQFVVSVVFALGRYIPFVGVGIEVHSASGSMLGVVYPVSISSLEYVVGGGGGGISCGNFSSLWA